MNKRARRLWGWGAFSALMLVGAGWGGMRLLAPTAPVVRGGRMMGISDEGEELLPASAPVPRFRAQELGFRHFPGTRTHRLGEDMGSGLAAVDLDGDGRLDLVLVQSAPLDVQPGPSEVWRNLGDMRFERAALLPALHGMGVAAGDMEGDGDLDLVLTGYGAACLLRNDGAFSFTDVTQQAGFLADGFLAGACWGDADGDGDLDVYLTRYVVPDESVPTAPSRRGAQSLPASLNPSAFQPAPNLLFLGDGAGRFREAARELGVDNPGGRSLGAVFADLDGDGAQDLYVANDVSDNALFRGRRGQAFEDVTHPSCTADPLGAMGLAIGDPDLDLDLDIFVTHWQTEENTLFEKLPHGIVFQDASIQTGLGPPGRGHVGWGTDFADFDNDGRPDLFVVNGSTFEEAKDPTRLVAQRPQLFWNAGKRFFDLAARAQPPLDVPWVARSMLAADLDDDGRVDWIVGRHGGPTLLLHNETEGVGGHLVVEPKGAGGNPFAYGARIEVHAGGRLQAQQVGTRVSYLGCGPPLVHVGLASAGVAERVIVRFPSGAVVERRDVPAGTRLVVHETDPRAMGSRMDAVGDALHEGRMGAAADGLRAILRDDPTHTGALYRLATLVPPEEGLPLLERLARLEPRSARAHLRRAQFLSDLRHPETFDLDRALDALAAARRINPNESGAGLESGRVLLMLGRPEEAAQAFEQGVGNARSSALAALAWLRAGKPERAVRLLGRAPGPQLGHADEGDTAEKRMDARDLVARALDLGPVEGFELTRLDLVGGGGGVAAFEDVDGDGRLDARVGAQALLLEGLRPRGVRSVEAVQGPRASALPPRYDLEAALRFALGPPARTETDPPGATAALEADLDGDGQLDRVVACGADDPTATLPWWWIRRGVDGPQLVRGAIPEPGWRVSSLAAADLDGDGRAELLLAGGGLAPGDTGSTWLVRWRR